MDGVRNIVLAGLLHDRNLGEQAIYESTRHSVERALRGLGLAANLIELDLGAGWGGKAPDPGWAAKLARIARRPFARGEGAVYEEMRRECRRKIDASVDAIIFTGGGLINFRHELDFGRLIGAALRRADRFGVPVMLSGMGIEGYDAASKRCKELKRCLNRSCVKRISTRDDLDALRERYLDRGRGRIEVMRVSDAACALDAIYPASDARRDEIGLGIGRAGLFAENGRRTTGEEMLALYSRIYAEIARRGKRCRLFTNGTLRDQRFAEALAERLGLDAGDPSLLAPRPECPAELVSIITSCEAVIATRLHACVIAYAYGVPFVGLVWNDKQIFFGEAIGHPDRFFEEGDFQAERIVDEALGQAGERDPLDAREAHRRAAYKESNALAIDGFIRRYVASPRARPGRIRRE